MAILASASVSIFCSKKRLLIYINTNLCWCSLTKYGPATVSTKVTALCRVLCVEVPFSTFCLTTHHDMFPFQNDNECEENLKKKFLHSSWDVRLEHTLLNLWFIPAENNHIAKRHFEIIHLVLECHGFLRGR